MGKAVALFLIVMIGATTTMPTLVMADGNYNCPPAATTPNVPGRGNSPAGGRSGGGSSSCPLDALKLGACVNLLGGLAHLGIGDTVVNQCCPVLAGVLELEAALCLCTTIRLKLLNLNVMLPLALELFVQCGLTPPPGFTCPPLN